MRGCRYPDITLVPAGWGGFDLEQTAPHNRRLKLTIAFGACSLSANRYAPGVGMRTHVEFRSAAFPPYPGEEEQINPDLYGKRLAEFVFDALSRAGFEPDEPGPEDWGWCVTIKNREFPLWVGCGHYQEYDDGFLLHRTEQACRATMVQKNLSSADGRTGGEVVPHV
jgi:hypothetical protein